MSLLTDDCRLLYIFIKKRKNKHLMKLKRIILLLVPLIVCVDCHQKTTNTTVLASSNSAKFSLETLEHLTFNWFWELVDKNNQVPDRHPQRNFTSIAATGFGLTAYCIGSERKYITREQAAERVLKTLQFLWLAPQGENRVGVSGFHGFFYHFLDHEKGLRFKDVELSSIDTGLLMAGVLSVMSYFDQDNPSENAVRKVADDLFRRVDWAWFLNDDKNLSMGYHPEKGFLKAEWIGYNEAMVLLIMAIGSPTHPIPADCWERWCKPYKWATFQGQEHVNFEPLFGHQYSHMYIDFKGIQDAYMQKKGIDYFENARRATYANRAYCIESQKKYQNYGADEWGLTACDGPKDTTLFLNNKKYEFFTYRARGAASTNIIDDGTIAPTAAGGSIPFAPEICMPALENMWHKYANTPLVTKYGFKDAYNTTYTFGKGQELGWVDPDYLGIDQGPILIQIENYRSQFVWHLMKKNPYIVEGLKKSGFKGGWLDALKN
jgi:hypothetical protein